MPDENHIEAFLSYLANETTARGRTSKETTKTYKLIIKQFIAAIDKKAEHITKSDIDKWKQYCSKFKESSLTNKYSAVKKYIKYLIREDFLDVKLEKYLEELKVPDVKKQKKNLDKQVLTEEQVEKIFEISKSNPLHHAIFMVFYYGMLRRKEICGLNLENVNFEKKTLDIIDGKGNVDATINLTQRCIDTLRNYIDIHRGQPRPGFENALFLYDGRRISRTKLHEFQKMYEVSAGIQRLHCHLWRHTGITHYAKVEKDIKILAKQTRHSDLEILLDYIHKSETEIRSSYDRAFEKTEPEQTTKPESKKSQVKKPEDSMYAQPTNSREEIFQLYKDGLISLDEFKDLLSPQNHNKNAMYG